MWVQTCSRPKKNTCALFGIFYFTLPTDGMPSLATRLLAPSVIGTELLLDKEILGAILISLRADQNWIDNLNMLRRVHSSWNHVARLICPELIPVNPRTFTLAQQFRTGPKTAQARFFQQLTFSAISCHFSLSVNCREISVDITTCRSDD